MEWRKQFTLTLSLEEVELILDALAAIQGDEDGDVTVLIEKVSNILEDK